MEQNAYFHFYDRADFLNFEIAKKHSQLINVTEQDGRPYCEMSVFDNAFLFGLLDQKKRLFRVFRG